MTSPSSSSIDSDAVEVPASRRRPGVEWQLCSQRVCFSNFAHLLGTHPRTIQKCIRGELDRRQLRGQSQPTPQSQIVDFFFYELYQSARHPVTPLATY